MGVTGGFEGYMKFALNVGTSSDIRLTVLKKSDNPLAKVQKNDVNLMKDWPAISCADMDRDGTSGLELWGCTVPSQYL